MSESRDNYINIIVGYWKRLEKTAGDPAMMPCAEENGQLKSIKEYHGCGGYGCVFPTNKPGVVFKITNDQTEASLISYLIDNNVDLVGMVKYLKIMRLPIRKDGYPIYAIWREEAYSVGKFDGADFFQEMTEKLYEIGSEIHRLVAYSDNPKKILRDASSYKIWAATEGGYYGNNPIMGATMGAKRLAAFLQSYEIEARSLAEAGYGYDVGETLLVLLSHGIVMCDLKVDNLGSARRHRTKEYVPVIVDPSLAMFIGSGDTMGN